MNKNQKIQKIMSIYQTATAVVRGSYRQRTGALKTGWHVVNQYGQYTFIGRTLNEAMNPGC
jgi:hypothetical protein